MRHGALLAVAEALRRLVCLLPLAWLEPVGRFMGRVFWVVLFGLRRLAERQLLEAGVARDPKEARRIGREVFESLAMNALEWLHSTGWSEKTFRERIEVDPEPMMKLLNEGRGLIVATGHLGNWEILYQGVGRAHGRKQYAVYAPQRNEAFNAWIIRQRERYGDKMISSQDGAIPMIRLLRRNNILGMLGDQDSKRVRGVFVQFFGRPAYTPAGIGLLAHLSGAPILPAAGRRIKGRPDRHEILFGDPIRPDPAVDAEADALRMTQAYTTWLEERIREAPEQWVWIHRRWKRMMKQE